MKRILAVFVAGVIVGAAASPLVAAPRCSTAYAKGAFALVCR